MHNNILKKLSWSMVFILFISWSGILQNAAYAQNTGHLNEEKRKKEVEKLEKLFDALEEAAKEIPRDTFDPQAIVDEVGKDPIRLFEWVRDNTYLVPYRGSLRGPIGVLMDRLGNSLDRALLLHELLIIAGHKARLARDTLSEKEAEMLMREARKVPKIFTMQSKMSLPNEPDRLAEDYAERFEIDKNEFRRSIQAINLEQQRLSEELTQRTADQAAEILGALEKAGINLTSSKVSDKHYGLLDHWWVQWQRDTNWIDLDPYFPDTKHGNQLAKVDKGLQPEDLDEDLLHLIDIRVVIEQLVTGDLKEHIVLEHTLHPSKLFGMRIVLSHVPINWPENFDPLADKNPAEQLKAAAIQENEWLPVLILGSKQIARSSFTTSGEVKTEPSKPYTPLKSVGGFLGDIASGIVGGKSEKEGSQLTAEWIEFEIRRPGYKPSRVRREIFDLLGAAVREQRNKGNFQINEIKKMDRGLSFLGTIDILPLTCQLSQEFVDSQFAEDLMKEVQTLTDKLTSKTLQSPKDLAIGMLESLYSLQGPLYSWARARMQCSGHRYDVYFDTVNIANFMTRPYEDLKGNMILRRAFDLVINHVAVHRQTEVSPSLVRLTQGIADTIAEGQEFTSAEGHERPVQLVKMPDKINTKWRVVRYGLKEESHKFKFPENIRIQGEQDLALGYTLVIPNHFVSIGPGQQLRWWRINLDNGQTVGVMNSGLHGAQTEYEKIEEQIVFFARYQSGALMNLSTTHYEILRLVHSFHFFVFTLLGPYGIQDRAMIAAARKLFLDLLRALNNAGMWP